MRLIDADALIGKLHEWDMQDLYLPCHFEDMIEEQPTAYDVEKVEEELLNKRELYRIREIESLRKGEPLNIGLNLAKQESTEDCIEVVKRGGVE